MSTLYVTFACMSPPRVYVLIVYISPLCVCLVHLCVCIPSVYMSLRVHVPFVCMSSRCDMYIVAFVCMFFVWCVCPLRVYVPLFVSPLRVWVASVCMFPWCVCPLRVYVPSMCMFPPCLCPLRVCPSVCMSTPYIRHFCVYTSPCTEYIFPPPRPWDSKYISFWGMKGISGMPDTWFRRTGGGGIGV